MRILLLGAAAIALSGCSFLGLGGHNDYKHHDGGNGYVDHHNTNSHSACGGTQCISRWNLEGGVGVASSVAGDLFEGTEAIDGAANLADLSMRKAYDPGLRVELGGSYALNPARKVTATGFYEGANGEKDINFGRLGNGERLTGSVSDYEAYGVELGLRQYFRPEHVLGTTMRPYVEGRLGATHVDDIAITGARSNGALLAGRDIGLFEGGWVGSAAGLVGIETPLTRYSTIGLETGVRYTQGLDGSNDVNNFGLEGVNTDGSRTSIPVMLRGRYRF